MLKIKILFILANLILTFPACSQQSTSEKEAGGLCEGCEAVLEYGNKKLYSVDTLSDYLGTGPKMLVTGTIYQKDGKTPARDVILYIYHTDQKGVYPTRGNETGWAKRHGYLQGWIKTGADGKYKFYTLKPAPYPNGNIPAHIHATVKQPGYSEYYIDEFLFDDDPLVTTNYRENLENRCGSGIVRPTASKEGLLVARRDIILGLNIPGY